MLRTTDQKKQKFGVNNPDKVHQIKDHGQSLYYEDNIAASRQIKVPPDRINNVDLIAEIQRDLDKAKKSCYLDNSRCFIPCDKFLDIINNERVLGAVASLGCYNNWTEEEKQRLAQRICFGFDQQPPSRKVFAVLIGINMINDLDEHVKDGLNDGCLPMKATRKDGEYVLMCNNGKHKHSVLSKYPRDEDRENFLKWTRYFMAPYVTSRKGLHPHYILDNGNCLPMDFQSKVCNPVGSEDHIPKNGGYGGFSEVYKVKIHHGHYYLGPSRMRNPDGFFALKKLTSHSRDNFNLELQSLLFSADRKGAAKKHVIQLLATFEENNSDNDHATFYFLFDWANGDLEQFWKMNSHFVCDMRHCVWMAEQFLGLAKALQAVHNDRQKLPNLPQRVSDLSLYGRHGDIKPANLLWFEECLALADFGLGRLHSKMTRSNQDPSLLAKTATYRAPEFDLPKGQGGVIGPTSDVYSLGCVYLEYISWFLLGLDGVNEFSKERGEKDKYGFNSDEFFRIDVSVSGNQQLATVKPSVRSWIENLKSQRCCSWYIHQMLDLIQDEMLHPDSGSRPRAFQIVKELERLQRWCKQNESFYNINWKERTLHEILNDGKAGDPNNEG